MKKSKPCSKCKQIKALTEFYKTSLSKGNGYQSQCKECAKLAGKNWYANNRDQKIESSKFYAQGHRKQKRASGKKHEQTYPERSNNRNHVRRAKFFGVAIYALSNKELKRIYSSPCFYCGSQSNQTMEHIIPFELGGTHGIGNVITACKSCNSSKNDRTIMEWVGLIPNAFPLRK